VYSIVIERPVAGEYNLRDEIDKACKKVVEMGFADPAKDLLTVTAGTIPQIHHRINLSVICYEIFLIGKLLNPLIFYVV
jgi:hypothetical protein